MPSSPLINIALPIAIALVMGGIGLHLRPSDFRRLVDHPRSVLVGMAGHYLLLPGLGFAVAWLFQMPPAIAIGLVLVTACPSGNMSNTLTFLARGNVALAISLTVVSALATFITVPVLVGLAAKVFAIQGETVRVPLLQLLQHLGGLLLVPISLGMWLHHRRPALAARLQPWVSKLAVLVLAILIVAIMSVQWALVKAAFLQSGVAVMVLCCSALAGGYGLAKIARLPLADRLTISMEVGIQNAAMAMLIALSVLNSPVIAVPAAVYGVVMYLPALVVVAWGRHLAATGKLATDAGDTRS